MEISFKSESFKKIFFVTSVVVIVALFVADSRKAEPDNQPFYNAKRLFEKIELKLERSNEAKVNYLYQLLDLRLSELQFLVLNNESPYILNASLRYSTTAGQITDLISQNNLVDQKPIAKQKFEDHLTKIEQLISSGHDNNGEIKYVTDDINYLKTYLSKLAQ